MLRREISPRCSLITSKPTYASLSVMRQIHIQTDIRHRRLALVLAVKHYNRVL